MQSAQSDDPAKSIFAEFLEARERGKAEDFELWLGQQTGLDSLDRDRLRELHASTDEAAEPVAGGAEGRKPVDR